MHPKIEIRPLLGTNLCILKSKILLMKKQNIKLLSEFLIN